MLLTALLLTALGSSSSPPGAASSSPATAPAAPAATQRICWRSTPREARKRSSTQAAAAGRLAQCNSTPITATTAATLPAGPGSPNGLSIWLPTGWFSSGPGVRLPATRPAAQQPKLASHNDQASGVLLRDCIVTVSSSAIGRRTRRVCLVDDTAPLRRSDTRHATGTGANALATM